MPVLWWTLAAAWFAGVVIVLWRWEVEVVRPLKKASRHAEDAHRSAAEAAKLLGQTRKDLKEMSRSPSTGRAS